MECFCDSGIQVHDTNLWDMAEEYNCSSINPTCPCKLMAPRNRSWAQRQLDELYEMQRIHQIERQQLEERIASEKKKVEQAKEKKENQPGAWHFWTFTQPDTEPKEPKRMLKAVSKCLKSKQINAEQWAYSIELTQQGVPHIHLRLFCSGYVDYRVPVGFNNGYGVKTLREKTVTGSSKYIIKEETKPSPEKLAEWGLDSWFFKSENYSGPLPETDGPS